LKPISLLDGFVRTTKKTAVIIQSKSLWR